MPRVPVPLGASPSPPSPTPAAARSPVGAAERLVPASCARRGGSPGGPAAAALLLRDGGTCRQAWRPPVSPKQEGTPPRRGLTLPQAVRAVGWGLLQPAERMRPPRGDPCKGAAVKGKTASGCGNAASSALVPRVQLCPGPPGSPQHPSVAKLISKTPGAAPGCGRGHRACARSLVSSRPFPGALGGLLDLGGHLGGCPGVSASCRGFALCSGFGDSSATCHHPWRGGEATVGTAVLGEQGPCPMSLAHQEHLPGLND